MTEKELLEKTICFVKLEFKDKSKVLIRTTLNADILKSYGASFVKGALFDLDKKKYYIVDRSIEKVDVFHSEETMNKGVREVDFFANRFI